MQVLLLALLMGTIGGNLIKAKGEELYKDYKVIESSEEYRTCKQELATSFASAYRAGKAVASSLNYGYSKMGPAEKRVMISSFLTTKKSMASTGVAFITTLKPELRERVSCYIGAHEELNAGFLSGFSENLIPILKTVYSKVPLL